MMNYHAAFARLVGLEHRRISSILALNPSLNPSFRVEFHHFELQMMDSVFKMINSALNMVNSVVESP